MPRQKASQPPIKTHINIPQDLYARAGLELFSEIRQGIPHGAWSQFFEMLLREHYRRIDEARAITIQIPPSLKG